MTVVATTTSKKTSPTPEPKKTMTVNDLTAVQKKRPAKSTMTLSERFTNDIGPKPKNSRVSLETSQTEISTLKKVPSKTMHSPEWSTYTEKGMNLGVFLFTFVHDIQLFNRIICLLLLNAMYICYTCVMSTLYKACSTLYTIENPSRNRKNQQMNIQ